MSTPCTPSGVPAARPTSAKPMWPIEEYAISRLMLRWPMAAKAPSTIEAMETKTTICCHSCVMPWKATVVGAHEDGDAGDLGRGGKERRDRRRRALVDVGRPHVERHRGNLEAEADEQKHDAEDQPDAALPAPRFGDAGEVHRAGEAVNQRGAVQQHAGRQRAEDEIFQARLGRFEVVAVRGGDHVERQAHQLEPEIERDQIGGGNQHHHAQRRQQHEDAEFEFLLLLDGQIIERQQQRAGRADEGQHLEKPGEVVDDKAAAKQFMASGRHKQHRPAPPGTAW